MVVLAATARFGSEPHQAQPVNEVACILAVGVAMGCATFAARRAEGRVRYGWLAMAVALLSWVLGEFLEIISGVSPGAETSWQPTPAGSVMVVFPVGALAALLLLSVGGGGGDSRLRLLLDGAVVATSLFVISWVFVLDHMANAGVGDVGPRLATVGQVIADLILLTTAILVWSRSPFPAPPRVALLVVGIMVICTADVITVYVIGIGGYHTGSLPDLVRIAGAGLLATAALAGVDGKSTVIQPLEIRPRDRVWLPYLPLLLAGVVGIGHAARSNVGGTLLSAEAILVAAVLARQALVLAQNQRLLTDVAKEAFHDSLTGLANRAHFVESLERALARGRRDGNAVSVLCIDLDDFKKVNDSLGHAAGDELLVRVAGRLTPCMGDASMIARLGGDEFAAIVEGPVQRSMATAHRMLDALQTPIVVDGVPLSVRPSVGLTVAASDGALTVTVDELVRHADLAMYAAKHDGGGCVRTFVPHLPFPYELPAPTEESQDEGAATAASNALERRPAATADPVARVSEFHDGIGWPPPIVSFVIALVTVGVIGFAVSSLLPDSPTRHLVFDVFLYQAVTLSAAGLIVVRALRIAAERWAWLFVAAGMVSSAVGDIVYEVWASDQFPSPADPFYLAFYPLMYVGLVLLIKDRLNRVPTAIRLDALVCLLTVGAVAAALVTGPLKHAMTASPSLVLTGLAYPAADLLLLTLAVGVYPSLGWRNETRWNLLVAGFAFFTLADTVYLLQMTAGSYREGALLDACWLLAALLIAIASWRPSSRVTPRSTKPVFSFYVLPAVFTIAALGVCLSANESRLGTALAALALTAVAARFSLTFRDRSAAAANHRLAMTDELTGLPNRRWLATTLAAMSIDEPPATFWPRRRIGLLWFDIDEFQEINTLVGRAVGDELLCRIG
jgi:diguanylate cyclase (GGDEF)-like protein